MSRRKEPIIGVIGGTGADKVDTATLKLAEDVGRSLTVGRKIVLTGGHPDKEETSVKRTVMQSALKVADDSHPARVIGILPGEGRARLEPSGTYPRQCLYIRSGLEGYERNVLNGITPDALVVLRGEVGTLSELAFGHYFGVPMVFLSSLASLKQVMDSRLKRLEKAISDGCSAYGRITGEQINCDAVLAKLKDLLGQQHSQYSDSSTALGEAARVAATLRGRFPGLIDLPDAAEEFERLVEVMGKRVMVFDAPNAGPEADG